MVGIKPKGSSFTLVFTGDEAKRLGLDKESEYELSKAREGMWVLIKGAKANSTAMAEHAAAEPAKPQNQQKPIDETEQKIIGLLRKTPARDRMEGWFEKKLSEAERKKFAEMLGQGRVIKFKSSETFRKALYTLPPKGTGRAAEEKKFENMEKPIEEFTLEKDGFLVVRNEARAKALSAELQERIKSGEIRGTRAFSGEFYIIRTDLLIAVQEKVLKELKAAKTSDLAAISAKLSLTPTLVKIAAAFLAEDGQIIEKRKEQYKYIE